MKRLLLPALAAGSLVGNALAGEAPASVSLADERTEYSFAAIQQLSEADLKEFYLRCARAATDQRLGQGEIALCSVGYERLLKGTFRGDFRALLEWRRSAGRSPDPLASPF